MIDEICENCRFFRIIDIDAVGEEMYEMLLGRNVCDLNGMLRYRNENCEQWRVKEGIEDGV